MIILLAYLAAAGAAGFAAMAWDKFQARRHGRRIPEKTLLALAAAGGSPGVYLGMRFFRHKTLHPKFSWGVPLIMVFQTALAAALYF